MKNNELFRIEAARMSNTDLAIKYDVSKRTIRRWKLESRQSMPPPRTPKYDEFMTVKADRAMVIGDVEVPCHDPEILEQACSIAKKFDIKTLIINGDFISLDSFSKWARSTVYKLAFKEELEPAVKILRIFLSLFSEVHCTTGNHERRLAHRLDGEITIADFFKSLAGVEFSEYSYCVLESGGTEILVAHQDNYSRLPLAVARELASIYHKNIICGHTHHQAAGFDKSGKYWIVDGGCMRDPLHTEYKSTRINTFPKWNAGGTFVIDGNPYLFNKSNYTFWIDLGGHKYIDKSCERCN